MLSSSIFSQEGGAYFVKLLVLKGFTFDEVVFSLSVTEARFGVFLLLCISFDRDNKKKKNQCALEAVNKSFILWEDGFISR